ncbi:MAG: polyamine aminopropyltransferase [Alphaproteobacteria bacterium]
MTQLAWHKIKSDPKLFALDALLLTLMAALAACGLIYQYILSHYAGRVLGLFEHAIFAMIGVMIVSMGIGAFVAQIIKRPFAGFAWLELGIATVGATAILLIAGALAMVVDFSLTLHQVYGVEPNAPMRGGILRDMFQLARLSPFAVGAVIGVLIGMEIPLIARIRQALYEDHLEHNVGTLYGADYLGAGVGAAIFVAVMLTMPLELAALWTALINVAVGLLFVICFRRYFGKVALLIMAHLLVLAGLAGLAVHARGWHLALEDILFDDQVVWSHDTAHQHITLTRRLPAPGAPVVHDLFINGRRQFSAADEAIYHELLVHPALGAAARQDKVLVIGGGDGLGLREIYKWRPEQVTLLELDDEIIRLFSQPVTVEDKVINQPLLALNKGALTDKRLDIRLGDAFSTVDDLLAEDRRFDAVIVDLPDPSHPNLNKLYSIAFYRKLRHLLSEDGTLAIQSTSPFHARDAFLTIGRTVEAAGFGSVERLRQVVPSFSEWGWTIATVTGASPRQRIRSRPADDWPEMRYATPGLIDAAFEMPAGYTDRAAQLEPNRMGSHRLYFLHQSAWRNRMGNPALLDTRAPGE